MASLVLNADHVAVGNEAPERQESLQEPEIEVDSGSVSEQSNTLAGALRVIRLAIKHGAPIYNEVGDIEYAAIYEVASKALVDLGSGLPKEAKNPLRNALLRIQIEDEAKQCAWVLCRGLDSASIFISKEMTSGSIQFDSK